MKNFILLLAMIILAASLFPEAKTVKVDSVIECDAVMYRHGYEVKCPKTIKGRNVASIKVE